MRDLQDLAATAAPIGIPSEHAWRDSTKTFYSEDDLESIRSVAHTLSEQITTVLSSAALTIVTFGLPELRTFKDVKTAVAIASVMARSPGAPAAVLGSEAWNRPPAEATQLIERGRQFDGLKARVDGCFASVVIEQDHSTDIQYVEQKSQGLFSFLSFLDSRYRSTKKRWYGYRLPSFQGLMMDHANEMKQVDRLRAERIAISQAGEVGRSLFGNLWQGERSSWDALDTYVQWVLEFRGLCVKHGLAGRTIDVASNPEPDISEVYNLEEQASAAVRTLQTLRQALGWPGSYLEENELAHIKSRADGISNSIAQAPQWAAFETARVSVHDGLASELLPAVFFARGVHEPFFVKNLENILGRSSATSRFRRLFGSRDNNQILRKVNILAH